MQIKRNENQFCMDEVYYRLVLWVRGEHSAHFFMVLEEYRVFGYPILKLAIEMGGMDQILYEKWEKEGNDYIVFQWILTYKWTTFVSVSVYLS